MVTSKHYHAASLLLVFLLAVSGRIGYRFGFGRGLDVGNGLILGVLDFLLLVGLDAFEGGGDLRQGESLFAQESDFGLLADLDDFVRLEKLGGDGDLLFDFVVLIGLLLRLFFFRLFR